MKIERNYDFRKRFDEIHKLNLRDLTLIKNADEVEIDENWQISIPDLQNETIVLAAEDLQDYFLKSMGISLKIVPGGKSGIIFQIDDSIKSEGGFRFEVKDAQIIISGNDAKGVFNGSIYLEDTLSLNEAPWVKIQNIVRKKLFTPRIVHSGWGIELFPDSHLNAIAHAGFDAIVVFVTAIDRTNVGVLDINNLIQRAKRYGLDTVLYSYLPAYKHPAEPDAQEFFDGVYKTLFEYYPDAKGVMLVGESAEFPSRDAATSGKKFTASVVDGIPDPKPSPGWWPCEDYPDWLSMVAKSVHKAKPDALVIFNTYNWGWTDENVRKKFLERFPKEVILQVTFEIFKSIKRENLTCSIMDYTISTDEPGFYFTSECANAAKLGIKLLATANTAGLTWDFGCVGRVPTPQQWIRKFKSLDDARKNWGLSRFYDNHHYGWERSVITDIGKRFFWSEQEDPEALLNRLAVRDFGKVAAPLVVEGWDKWSEAIKFFTPTNEDQYGPFRVGPSYPFIFHPNITRSFAPKEINFPTQPGAHFGYHIIKTMYQPFENIDQAPGCLRYPVELRSLENMRKLWIEGLNLMKKALLDVPERKQENLLREINLGEFILCTINTGINMKNWYILNQNLTRISSAEEGCKIIAEIEKLAAKEIENAKNAIPLVERDSRLGWEPSMEYVTDKWHLEWKLRQMQSMLLEVADYKKILEKI